MEIEANSEMDGVVELRLRGNLDLDSGDELRETAIKLLEQGTESLALDFSGVYFMDSYGMGVLIGILRRVAEGNGTLVLHSLSPNIKRIFDLTRLNLVIDISGNRQEARQKLLTTNRRR